MGLFDKVKKPDKQANSGSARTGFVLLQSEALEWDAFAAGMRGEWGIDFSAERRDNSAVYTHEGMMVAVSLMPAPVPGGEAEANARSNYLWPEAEEVVKTHNAHILLAVLGGNDPLAAALLFTKVASVLLRQQNALAIYAAPTVYSAEEYVEMAGMLHEPGALPVPLLVYIGLARSEKGICGYTVGLAAFGREEIEVLDAAAQPGEMYSFLCSMAEYVVTSGAALQPGETVGFSEGEKLPITRSPGVFVPGDTLKIRWKGSGME